MPNPKSSLSQSPAWRDVLRVMRDEAKRIDRTEIVDGVRYDFIAYKQCDGVVRVDIRRSKVQPQ